MHHSSNQILLGASYLVIQNKNHTMAYKPLQKRIPLYISESESRSLSVVSDTLQPRRLYSPRNSPGQNPGVGSLFLLQGIFPTQGLNPGVLHCRQILYQLSHEGGPIMHLRSSTIYLNNLFPLHFVLAVLPAWNFFIPADPSGPLPHSFLVFT